MSLPRTLLRGLFRGRLIGRRLPREFGAPRVYLAPESQLKHLLPGRAGFDPELLAWAQRHVGAGDVVWDVGANCGVFAVAAAGLGARVLAVEPDPFLAHALLKTRVANPSLQLDIATAAVSDRRGSAVLNIASGGRAANALSAFAGERTGFGSADAAVIVPTLTLDDLLEFSRPAFVKIDIEGAEVAALTGAARLLSEVRPTMVVEVECGHPSREEVFGILRSARYELRSAADPAREPTATTFNILALPLAGG